MTTYVWAISQYTYVRKIHCWPRFRILYEGIDRRNKRIAHQTQQVKLLSVALHPRSV